jgi:hypothetical protein
MRRHLYSSTCFLSKYSNSSRILVVSYSSALLLCILILLLQLPKHQQMSISTVFVKFIYARRELGHNNHVVIRTGPRFSFDIIYVRVIVSSHLLRFVSLK